MIEVEEDFDIVDQLGNVVGSGVCQKMVAVPEYDDECFTTWADECEDDDDDDYEDANFESDPSDGGTDT